MDEQPEIVHFADFKKWIDVESADKAERTQTMEVSSKDKLAVFRVVRAM